MTDSTPPAAAHDSEVVTTATGPTMRDRFRGFLPVVVDIETGGFNCQTDAILEIAMTLLTMSEDGQLEIAETERLGYGLRVFGKRDGAAVAR